MEAVDFRWAAVEEGQSRNLEHLELAVEPQRQQPCIAGSTGRTQHNHLIVLESFCMNDILQLTISGIRISLAISSIILGILSSVVSSWRWAGSSWSGWHCWAHDATRGVRSWRVAVSPICSTTTIRVGSVWCAISIPTLTAISSALSTVATLWGRSVLELFVLLSDVLKKILTELLRLLHFIWIGATVACQQTS